MALTHGQPALVNLRVDDSVLDVANLPSLWVGQGECTLLPFPGPTGR
jgi:hypothetical protein